MTPYCSVGKIKVPKNPVKMFNHKNAMRRIRNSGRCRGYHETLGHTDTSVHHTESILPASCWNVKKKYGKKEEASHNM